MGLLKWVFSIGESYRKEQIKYAKMSNGSKIVNLVISALFTIGAIVLVWFTLKSFANNVGVGILLAILSVAMVMAMAKTNGLSCMVALKNTIRSAIQDKVNDKLNEFEAELKTELGKETEKPVVTEEMKEARTNKRVLDIITGVIYGVLAIGVVVASIAMLISAIMPTV
jgi:TRAP-type C4-dicarboxylate transport system permease small subunit